MAVTSTSCLFFTAIRSNRSSFRLKFLDCISVTMRKIWEFSLRGSFKVILAKKSCLDKKMAEKKFEDSFD